MVLDILAESHFRKGEAWPLSLSQITQSDVLFLREKKDILNDKDARIRQSFFLLFHEFMLTSPKAKDHSRISLICEKEWQSK